MSAITAQGLVKCYGNVIALAGVSFSVPQGAIFGLLGPNGAGKTTAIECLIGLKRPDEGSVSVLGMDPARERKRLFRRVGVQLQEANYQDRIRVRELCSLYASMYLGAADWEKLLERFGIGEKRDAFVGSLSGGQKRKLSVLLALLPRPEAVFLDELTTGLDPNARRAMWRHVRELREDGRTVFLTTHYMEEAEQLCDGVAVIDRGRVVASGTVKDVVAAWGPGIAVSFASDDDSLLRPLELLEQVAAVERREGEYVVRCTGERGPGRVVYMLEARGTAYANLNIRRPSLEDAYVRLTGRSGREGGNE